jgi:hypothetical protein
MSIAMSARSGQQVKLSLMDTVFRGRIVHMTQKIPGFSFSGYPTIQFYMTVLIAMDQYAYIRDVIYSQLPETQRLLI